VNVRDGAYLLASGLLAPFMAPKWLKKDREGFRHKLGKLPALPPKSSTRPRVMLHGVSVGEVAALSQIVPILASRNLDLIVSVSTDTGFTRAKALYAKPDSANPPAPLATIVRYPLDFTWVVKKFLDAVQPDVVALCELEVWPNFIAECARRNIPVLVINGRLSAKSFRGYRLARPLLRKTFARLHLAAVQDDTYAERFLHMGVQGDRLQITGTMKWDTAVIAEPENIPGADALAASLGIDRKKPLIVAGSTADGEEKLLHESCPAGVQLLCAPRKPERFDEAAAALPGCNRRSKILAGQTATLTTNRFLLDTVGELRMAYALADIVVIGRSFAKLGGSDPIEPVGLGKPVLIGKHYHNFTTVVETLFESGALEILHAGELRSRLSTLLTDQAQRSTMARRGRATIREHQGATALHADLICAAVKAAQASM
jgi:3-deoxy-D-manno-octulosonic-acid transferase